MIEKFIEENIESDVKSFETIDDLYKRYLCFCEVNGLEALTKRMLNNRLSKLNVGVRHKRMRNYSLEYDRQGVKLLPCKY
ncbi:primase-like DNA-binding domain-containing protein [Lysinibacillus odysseyi]|uniref:DNA primase/nucleoside triphosphatase C-terminal domain-containing protein n=1 Tax=Lysinibacillus odysseyi 34hs-1 = NBRC 100172 TaxID=1220589 RepID=A0A0A3IV93_9BACI|nr:hypothetical protein CD32_01165 [Lysinibacillus odysseyi 34hs-1 = NBRC 100172]